ncbi:MAG TPA: hypothetical protein VGX48_24585 [Pyrinomonadaceae bacterium]|nr:hypothetical protein [Pyrinomonadaceae bacterium]
MLKGLSGRKRLSLIALCGVAAVSAALWLSRTPGACAVTPGERALASKKNRAAAPRAKDFDARVTLESLLAPGDDRSRWSESRAGAIEGYVVEVKEAGVEAANCFLPWRRDVHIDIASSPDAPPAARVVAEVTPGWGHADAHAGLGRSADALRRELVGRRCRVEGWLLFDLQHAEESENVSPGRDGNWRGTAWELHPVTAIKVIE